MFGLFLWIMPLVLLLPAVHDTGELAYHFSFFFVWWRTWISKCAGYAWVLNGVHGHNGGHISVLCGEPRRVIVLYGVFGHVSVLSRILEHVSDLCRVLGHGNMMC